MYVCIGSKNPVKIKAVENAFKHYYEKVYFFNIKANSKVSDQPIGLDVILKGAYNRALAALRYLETQEKIEINDNKVFGVGIEAGLVRVPMARTSFMDFQFCIIMDEKREITIGSGIGFEYPEQVIKTLVSKKTEIGTIMGNISGNENLKKEGGAISFLSKNVIKRENILEEAVICALLPRINKLFYLK
ncbi:MAG: inosine/xanthosine triphosphatase [Promethearchaeota archaeon]|nr:MAG: inosine/xanthosine triphosphatase [Candidatus Lokiarchaeota archaeon]